MDKKILVKIKSKETLLSEGYYQTTTGDLVCEKSESCILKHELDYLGKIILCNFDEYDTHCYNAEHLMCSFSKDQVIKIKTKLSKILYEK